MFYCKMSHYEINISKLMNMFEISMRGEGNGFRSSIRSAISVGYN